MRYMRWSWLDYLHTPPDVIGKVIERIEAEIREQEIREAAAAG